ncbi:MAG: hypothetical protein NTU97_01470, partial [Candidatus Magasanikbacteria bacterium]|nr:hypothetical protein [Candidatus Magasanikbacteria bacterium]
MNQNFKTIFSVFFSIFLWGSFLIFSAPNVQAVTTAEMQNKLEEELKVVEQQIAQFEQELKTTSQQKNTLTNKIKQLKTQQAALSAQIKATSLTIDSLNYKIADTEQNIKKNEIQQQKLKDDIVQTIRLLYKGEINFFLNVASKNTLSEAYVEIDDYLKIMQKLNFLVVQAEEIKQTLKQNQEIFSEQQDEASTLLNIKAIQQSSLKKTITEQAQILESTKGLERNYQTVIADSKKKAAEIRSRIYELFNTGKQINFAQALEITEWVSTLTGLRPAFLLAILTQESNVGKNVGTCNRT